MIVKNFTQNGASITVDAFTESELNSIAQNPITSNISNGGNNTITYYQGDEPVVVIPTDVNTIEYWDVRGLETKQYIQVRSKIKELLLTEMGGTFSGWNNLSLEKKKIASKWMLHIYSERIKYLSDEEDLIYYTNCLEETAGIFKHNLKGRARIIEEMRQFVAKNYSRKDLLTKAQEMDFYTTCESMLNNFEKVNGTDFKYWLNNTTGTAYQVLGFKQKDFYKIEIETALNNILNGNY